MPQFERGIRFLITEMNKILVVILAFMSMMFVACQGNKMLGDNSEVDSDSIYSDSIAPDTLEQFVEETPMPKAADELFDDFFFNFAANRKLQRERIVFPLPVTKENMTNRMNRKEWKTDNFFMEQGYYTLIFNNRWQMERVKDTAINHVIVKKIFLESDCVREYVFNRRNGLWTMMSINDTSIGDSPNASFLTFYKRFAADVDFQVESIDETVNFSGPDPDDDFSTMEGLLTPDTWPAFAPELPTKMIYNIEYGEKYADSNKKIFLIRGIANGLETELTFQKKDGHWKVTSLTQ